MKTLLLISMMLFSSMLFSAADNVAVVKLLRGDVEASGSKLKLGDWVKNGAVVKTAEKSFVKLIFSKDQSQINVGPSSEMKIEKFDGKDSGVIDLVKGKIRSQVTKDYLQIDKDKSKMFVKTPNAVMGIRGTDFEITTNGKNTSAVLFEGSVVFNHLPSGTTEVPTSQLEQIVNDGVKMSPGDFSTVPPDRATPTEPAKLNVEQLEKMEKNVNLEASAPKSDASGAGKSVVPEGLSGSQVANTSSSIKTEIAAVASTGDSNRAPASVEGAQTPSASDNGYVSGDSVKPANGSFLHPETGTIIPPSSDAVFDPNTKSYVGGSNVIGSVDASGQFVPKPNIVIQDNNTIVIMPTAAPTTSANSPSQNSGANSVAVETKPVILKLEPVVINQPVLNSAATTLPGTGGDLNRLPAAVAGQASNTTRPSSDINHTQIGGVGLGSNPAQQVLNTVGTSVGTIAPNVTQQIQNNVNFTAPTSGTTHTTINVKP